MLAGVCFLQNAVTRRSQREKNRAKKIAKLNDDSCADESQDIECEERDSFQRKKKEHL